MSDCLYVHNKEYCLYMQCISKKNFINNIVGLMAILLLIFIYGLKIYEIVVRADFQWEVREGVGIYMAQRFAAGINPYIYREGLPEAVYMYGFIMPAILSIFIKLGIPNIILFAQFLTIGVEIVGVLLFGVLLKRNSIRSSICFVGMVAMSGCYFRTAAYGGVFPDTYGLTLLIFIWLIVNIDESKKSYKVWIYAFLCTLSFYIKQYFVFISLGFLVFFVLKRSYKCLCKFVAVGSAFGIGSIIIVRLLFPTYFTTNSYFLGVYNAYSVDLAIGQILDIISLFPIFVGIIIVGGISVLCGYKYNGFDDNIYAIAQAITMLIIGTILSTSNGAWLTYFLQLSVPYIIFIAVLIMDDWGKKKHIVGICSCIASLFFLISILLFSRDIYFVKHIGEGQKKQWNDVYEILDNYKDGNVKVSALPLTFYCINNNIYSDNTGHSNCYTYELSEMINSSNPSEIVFPYAKQLSDQYMEYNRSSLEKCQEGFFDCIVLEKNNYYREEIENAVSENYIKAGDYCLVCGVEEWECSIYVKKDGK